jgi:hypothetical protein
MLKLDLTFNGYSTDSAVNILLLIVKKSLSLKGD